MHARPYATHAAAADNGATAKQLMAIFGRSPSKIVDYYTQVADQKRLA
jgi:hypothetical protein